MERNLIQNTDTLSILFENKNNMENITEIVNNLHEKLNLRITIINESGEVIADSDKTDLAQINNHLNRKEIIQARYNEIGKDKRKSETVDKDLFYIAKKIVVGNNIYYVRIADYINNITDNYMNFTFEIFFFITFFLLMSFLATYFINLRAACKFHHHKLVNL